MDWPLNAYTGIAFNDKGYDLQSYSHLDLNVLIQTICALAIALYINRNSIQYHLIVFLGSFIKSKGRNVHIPMDAQFNIGRANVKGSEHCIFIYFTSLLW